MDEKISDEKDVESPSPDKIKHIVLSGGGIVGLAQYGALRESHQKGLWNMNNIESIYGTSVGALISVIISLKFDWEVLDDFIIKRPWNQIIKLDMFSVIQSFETRGLMNTKIIEDVFAPLFGAKNIELDVTMKEFYEITKIDLHLFVTELNTFELVDICRENYPDWKVIDAVYASCCIPILFSPLLKDDKCYIDGGFRIHYPLANCTERVENTNEILGICQNMKNNLSFEPVRSNSTLFEFVLTTFYKIIENMFSHQPDVRIKHEIVLGFKQLLIYEMFDVAASRDRRIALIEKGAYDYYSAYHNICEDS